MPVDLIGQIDPRNPSDQCLIHRHGSRPAPVADVVGDGSERARSFAHVDLYPGGRTIEAHGRDEAVRARVGHAESAHTPEEVVERRGLSLTEGLQHRAGAQAGIEGGSAVHQVVQPDRPVVEVTQCAQLRGGGVGIGPGHESGDVLTDEPVEHLRRRIGGRSEPARALLDGSGVEEVSLLRERASTGAEVVSRRLDRVQHGAVPQPRADTGTHVGVEGHRITTHGIYSLRSGNLPPTRRASGHLSRCAARSANVRRSSVITSGGSTSSAACTRSRAQRSVCSRPPASVIEPTAAATSAGVMGPGRR